MKSTILEIVNKGKFAILSNFFIDENNESFRTVAHAHYFNMAKKEKLRQDLILKCRYPFELYDALGPDMYSRCSNITLFNKHYEFGNTFAILWVAISNKLYNNPLAVQMLLATDNLILQMMSDTDNVIGVGRGRRGLNISGKILMQLREYYRSIKIIKIIKIRKNEKEESALFDDEKIYSYNVTPIREIENAYLEDDFADQEHKAQEEFFRYF